jgi:putative spermidine/putrescine transport system ATP-binding protein
MTTHALSNRPLAGFPPLVSFRRVRKSFDGMTDAVTGLELDVARGEFLTLLGPSGSGKTTTLMMLAGFEQPDGGDILLDGRPITRLPPHRRGIGVVFQSYALFPHMTVAQNVAFPLAVRGQPAGVQAAKVAAVLDMVRMSGLGGRLPAQLSGGQQQRVALARALVFEPKLVLLDEPLGALDRALREEMQEELRTLHQRLGITMLYVTHDQAEALSLSDRIAVFAAGRLRQLGTPRQLYDEPASAFVARFVGENNFLPGQVLAIAGGVAQVQLDCGAVVAAGAVDAGIGAPCVVAVRPEQITVAALIEGVIPDGSLRGRVREAIFGGDHMRLRLSIGAADITVKQPAGGASDGLIPGAEVAVAWQQHHGLAFRPEDGRGTLRTEPGRTDPGR